MYHIVSVLGINPLLILQTSDPDAYATSPLRAGTGILFMLYEDGTGDDFTTIPFSRHKIDCAAGHFSRFPNLQRSFNPIRQ